MAEEIWTIDDKKKYKFLRKKTTDFNFKKFTKPQIAALIKNMRAIMRKANGIGLSANQIGLNLNMFVAEVPDAQGGTKFYSIFNPRLESVSEEKATFEEGCLSIPGVWGDVPRAEKVVIAGFDKNGKAIKIKAWGLLARVFQHETDHLNGRLFIDRTKAIYREPKKEK